MHVRITRAALGVLVASIMLGPLAPAAAAGDGKLRAYRGLGAWVDIYDRGPWRNPSVVLAKMEQRGVRTLFLQTSNYQRKQLLYRSRVIGRFLDAAHKRNIRVVAWYVPSFVRLKRDYKRVLSAVRFRSARGERFDSFALDIEADQIGNISVRNDRLIRLSRRVRAAVGRDYALGAIVPDPIGTRFWPNFPYRRVARLYDVFVPMSYFTYRTHGYKGVLRHTRAGIRRIRERSGDRNVPIHVIGGEADDAGRHEVKAFVRAVKRADTIGASLYDYAITRRPIWARLRALIPRTSRTDAARGVNDRTSHRRRGRPGRARRHPKSGPPERVVPGLNRGLLIRRCVQAAGPPPCTLVSLGLQRGSAAHGRPSAKPVE